MPAIAGIVRTQSILMPAAMRFSPSSRARLTTHDLGRFPGSGLFDRIGRAVCEAGCLPRKELYEAWEVARRARRLFRGGRVVDIGAGHGLLAQIMLLLDDASPDAVAVDVAVPASAARVHEALVSAWPRLEGRVRWTGAVTEAGGGDRREGGRAGDAPAGAPADGGNARDRSRAGSRHGPVRASSATGGVANLVPSDVTVGPGDIVVSCHACGALTDRVIEFAIARQAHVAVLPCCHDVDTCDAGDLTGWMDPALAIDATRVARLRAAGYRVRTQAIPAEITPRNRLILGTGLFSTEIDRSGTGLTVQ